VVITLYTVLNGHKALFPTFAAHEADALVNGDMKYGEVIRGITETTQNILTRAHLHGFLTTE
jgi:hypothetical protein